MLNNASKSTCCRHKLKIKQLRTVIYIVLYRSSKQLDNLYTENEAYYFNITGIQDEKMRDQGLRIDRRRSARF